MLFYQGLRPSYARADRPRQSQEFENPDRPA
jgi:hypothetical protein